MYCKNCGNEIERDALYCNSCEKKVSEYPVGLENEIGDKGKELVYSLRAYKQLARFSYREINARVKVIGDSVTTETDYHGKVIKRKKELYRFNIKDIAGVKTGFGSIILFIDILRFIMGIVCTYVTGLYGLVVLAIFYYITLSRVIRIKLRDGTKIKLFYENPYEVEALLDELTV